MTEAEASHKLCPSHAPLNQLEIFMKMRKWVHGCFVTMISTPLMYSVLVGLAVDTDPQPAAGKGKPFYRQD